MLKTGDRVIWLPSNIEGEVYWADTKGDIYRPHEKVGSDFYPKPYDIWAVVNAHKAEEGPDMCIEGYLLQRDLDPISVETLDKLMRVLFKNNPYPDILLDKLQVYDPPMLIRKNTKSHSLISLLYSYTVPYNEYYNLREIFYVDPQTKLPFVILSVYDEIKSDEATVNQRKFRQNKITIEDFNNMMELCNDDENITYRERFKEVYFKHVFNNNYHNSTLCDKDLIDNKEYLTVRCLNSKEPDMGKVMIFSPRAIIYKNSIVKLSIDCSLDSSNISTDNISKEERYMYFSDLNNGNYLGDDILFYLGLEGYLDESNIIAEVSSVELHSYMMENNIGYKYHVFPQFTQVADITFEEKLGKDFMDAASEKDIDVYHLQDMRYSDNIIIINNKEEGNRYGKVYWTTPNIEYLEEDNLANKVIKLCEELNRIALENGVEESYKSLFDKSYYLPVI